VVRGDDRYAPTRTSTARHEERAVTSL